LTIAALVVTALVVATLLTIPTLIVAALIVAALLAIATVIASIAARCWWLGRLGRLGRAAAKTTAAATEPSAGRSRLETDGDKYQHKSPTERSMRQVLGQFRSLT